MHGRVDWRPCGRSDVRPVGHTDNVMGGRTCDRTCIRANGVMGGLAHGRNDTWTDTCTDKCAVKLTDGRASGRVDCRTHKLGGNTGKQVDGGRSPGGGWVDGCAGGVLCVVSNVQHVVVVSVIVHILLPFFVIHHPSLRCRRV